MDETPSRLDPRSLPSADGACWDAEIGSVQVLFGPGRLVAVSDGHGADMADGEALPFGLNNTQASDLT